jgi:oligopeptidase B
MKQQEVKGFEASHYRSEHLWIQARDGGGSGFAGLSA